MTRRAAVLWIAAAFALLAADSPAAVRPDLKPWPGPGFKTSEGSYLRPLYPGVSFTPLLTVGDTLLPPSADDETFVFLPLPDGLGIRAVRKNVAEIYVAHETSWQDGLGGGRVSRLLLDTESRRVLAADWIVDGIEGFDRLCAAELVETHEGFLIPHFLVNEESIEGLNRGVVAAVNLRSGLVTTLPWLGRFRHEKTLILPVTNGRLAAILTEDGLPGQSQLYLYLANGDTDFLTGQGQLYVFRADAPRDRPNTGLASMARKLRPLSGRFVPLPGFVQDESALAPASLEAATRAAGALNFVRLEDATPDRRNPSAFYLADTGAENFMDPASGRPVTGKGRIYRVELDPFDPTIVRELSVLLDGDEADDLYRPDNLETDERGLMIQEDPGRRGIHPARILRYDLETRRLDPLAECVERDAQGRVIPEGTGGAWESTGIVDASAFFGPGTWLVAVQAHTDFAAGFGNRGGGGQLLIMKAPARGEAPKKKGKDREGATQEEPKENEE
jgi:hypothetical protein